MLEAKCAHCGVDIDFVYGRWVDAGTDSLVFCDDGTGLDCPSQRHEVRVETVRLPGFREAVTHVVNVGAIMADLDRVLEEQR